MRLRHLFAVLLVTSFSTRAESEVADIWPVQEEDTLEEGKYKWGVQYHLNSPLYTLDVGKRDTSFRYSGDIFGEYRFSSRWGVRVSLGHLQMQRVQSFHSASDDQVDDTFITRRRGYGMFSLTFRRYVGEKKRLGISLGPCVALPFYGSETYARTSSYMPMPQKSEHVVEEMEDDAHHDAPRVPRPVVLSVPVQWGDSCVGVKVGVDYEFDNGFLLGVDLNMLSCIRREHAFERDAGLDYSFEHGRVRRRAGADGFFSSPLFSLSLKLGWNLHTIFEDESTA